MKREGEGGEERIDGEGEKNEKGGNDSGKKVRERERRNERAERKTKREPE